jgi:hypothetical protein
MNRNRVYYLLFPISIYFYFTKMLFSKDTKLEIQNHLGGRRI